MMAMPFGDSMLDGMMLFWNGCPLAGLRMICGVLKNGFDPSSWLKSPLRIAIVGTIAVLVCTAK